MHHATTTVDRPIGVDLTRAATAAGYAPSILNTQPWRWRLEPGRLHLFAERSRQLTVTDPQGRTPEATRIDPLPPATETVRYRGSYLVAPVQGPVPAAAAAAPRTAAHAPACGARTRARSVRLRRGRATVVRATLTRRGRAARGALVTIRGPGFARRARTDRYGRVRFAVRARRGGRATVSAAVCGGRLTVTPGRRRGRY